MQWVQLISYEVEEAVKFAIQLWDTCVQESCACYTVAGIEKMELFRQTVLVALIRKEDIVLKIDIDLSDSSY